MNKENHCRFPEWGRVVVRNFFLPSLNLFYDYTTGDSFEHRFDHLPKLEEIAAEDPDPCGRGSGMEDCALHAGAMLDAAIRCDESELASRVLIGLESLVVRHGRPGFVARGFSPFAGNLCYPNSSRDQFTLAVFGAWRAFCAMPSAMDRQCAAEILRNISEYCLENVTAENGFNLGRFDGGPAMVSLMRRGCAPHEALRLPMFHAAAGVATGESERIAVAAALLPEAIAKTLEMRDDGGWWDISLSQFQLSVAVLLECNVFPEAVGTLREISREICRLTRRELEILLARGEADPSRLNARMCDWRDCPRRLLVAPAAEGGRSYRHVTLPQEYQIAAGILRGIGNLLTALFYGKEAPSPEAARRIVRLLSAVDFPHCSCGGTIQLLQGVSLFPGLVPSSISNRKGGSL